jgi:hypothetical protein
MKKQRVDLLKNMRAENKKFQQFKNAKNKEIVQIKRLGSFKTLNPPPNIVLFC